MSEPGAIRNLDQLQEDDDDRKMPRGVTMALVVLGGACVVFAGLALGGRTSQTPAVKVDPLGDLVSQRSRPAGAPASSARPATDLQPRDVTFPQMLSDDAKPPTALAAVRPNGTAATLTVRQVFTQLPFLPPIASPSSRCRRRRCSRPRPSAPRPRDRFTKAGE